MMKRKQTKKTATRAREETLPPLDPFAAHEIVVEPPLPAGERTVPSRAGANEIPLNDNQPRSLGHLDVQPEKPFTFPWHLMWPHLDG